MCFYHVFIFWWGLKFPQQNINQSETWIGGFQLSAELLVVYMSVLVVAEFVLANIAREGVQTPQYWMQCRLAMLTHFIVIYNHILHYTFSFWTSYFSFYFVLFFFYLSFLSQPFTNHRTAGEMGVHFFNSSPPLSPASQTRGHYISRAITAENSPLHIGSSRTQTGNLWFPSPSR